MIEIILMLYKAVASLWAVPVIIYAAMKLIDGDKLLDVTCDSVGIIAFFFVVEAILGYILAWHGYTFPIQ